MLNSFSEILHCLTYPGNKLNLQSSWFIRTGRCFWPISHQVRFPRNLARVLSRPLHTGCVFVLQIFRMSVIFLKLLVGHECFHTEPEHHAAKKRPFYFSHYIVDFSEVLPGKAPQALGCVASRRGRRDSSGHWHWSRPHLPGPQTKAIRPHPPGCCPGSL